MPLRMHQRSALTATMTARAPLAWPTNAMCPMLQSERIATSHRRVALRQVRLRSGPAGVILAAAAASHTAAAIAATASAAAAATARDHRGARTPAQLAEELYQYAAAAVAAGRRPGNDAFLAAHLSELSDPHRLRRLRPRQLATLLRSLVHLGAHPGEDWLAELDACCYCHPGPFDPASATAVLQSLASLHSSATAAAAAAATSAPDGATSASAPASATATVGGTRTSSSGHNAQHQRLGGRRRGNATATRSSSRAGGGAQQLPTSVATAASSPSAASATSVKWTCQGETPPPPPSFLFPQAVYLRLLQGGVHNYTYEQLATLLQSFRSLGVPVSDEIALQVGRRMATQLLEMGPEQRHRALAAVLGAP